MKTEVNYSETYWSNKGNHTAEKDAIQKLIPDSGEVENAALERFRVASNCYYDLYNNGLGNRGQEFHKTFGFDAFDIGEWHGRYYDNGDAYEGSVELTQELVDRTESTMDEIILAAYAEQFPPKPTGETIDITPVGLQTPEGNARVQKALSEWTNATAQFANLAAQGIKAGWLKPERFVIDEWSDLNVAMEDRDDKQEAFLRAVAGVPEQS